MFRYVAITFNSWTAVNKNNYLAVTGHFVHNYVLKTCLLGFLESSESHTAVALVELLKLNVLNKYPHIKVVCSVTDSAANMIKTCKDLKIRHLPCFLHKVQTTVNKALARASNCNEEENLFEEELDQLDEIDELVFCQCTLYCT